MPPLPSDKLESVSSTIVIKNKLDELAKVSEWLHSFTLEAGISTESTFRLELALVEAVTNVIQYAFEEETEHRITLKLRYHQPHLTFILIDDGWPFDLTQYPAVELPKTLEEAGDGGLGVYLIRNYADEIHYQRQNDQNILTMRLTINLQHGS